MVSALTGVSTGRAELIPSDHPNPQQARITFDTDTGLSWLDVTESVGLSYADVEAGAGGFVTEGWRHATICRRSCPR